MRILKFIELVSFTISIVMLVLLFSGSVSALDWDNTKSYNSNTKTITITNAFGLGSEIATIKLDTPQNVYVIAGKDRKVAEFTIKNNREYSNAFKQMQFYNLKDSSKEIGKVFKYKYKVNVGKEEKPTYETICHEGTKEEINGTLSGGYCESKETGKETIDIYDWKELELSKIGSLPQGEVTIGIFTDVKRGDKVEWIPTFFGVKIEEWATWTESLSNGLYAYYKMDEALGSTIAKDSIAGRNATKNGAGLSLGSTGKLGNGANYTNDVLSELNSTLPGLTTATSASFAFWYRRSTTTTDYQFMIETLNVGGSMIHNFAIYTGDTFHWDFNGIGGGSIATTDGVEAVGTWVHIVGVANGGSNMTLYKDGAWLASDDITANFNVVSGGLSEMFIMGYTANEALDGQLDEVGFWNRSLSGEEVAQLYNSGTGITYELINNPPAITNVFPVNNTISTSSPINIEFNATVTDIDLINGITNISLYINGVKNYSENYSEATSVDFTKTISLGNGVYYWYINATDSAGLSSRSEIRTLTIDNTTPFVNITTPINGTTLITTTERLSVNINATISSISGFSNCWYYNNSANTTITCGNNITANFNTGWNHVIYYANSTLGIMDYGEVYFFVYAPLLENSQTYNSITSSGNKESFSINLTYDSAHYTSISAALIYNSTSYSGTKSGAGDNAIYNVSFIVPSVMSQQNKSFYWIISLTNSSGVNYFNSTIKNQTINPVSFDNCAVYTKKLINFSLFDEDARTPMNGTIEAIVNLYTYGTDSLVRTFNISFAYDNILSNAQICIENITGTYTMDYQAKYYSNETYQTENKYSNSMTLNNNTAMQQINLYDLLTSRATVFQITVQGGDLANVVDAIVDVQRQYVPANQFISVESPKTDQSGRAIANLVAKTVTYNFVVSRNGVILGTFNNYVVKCANEGTGDCQIKLNIALATAGITDYTKYGNVSTTFDLNKITRILTMNYFTTDSQVHSIKWDVLLNDGYGNTTICTRTDLGSSGTYTCSVPTTYGNSSLYAEIYSDSVFVGRSYFSLQETAESIFGGVRVIIGILMYTTLVLMMMFHPLMIVIGSILGLVFAGAFFMVDGGTIFGTTAILAYFVIAGVIIIHYMRNKI